MASSRPSDVSMAPVISPVISSGELFGDALVGDLPAAAQHDDAVGDREDVGHAVADQHHRDALVAQAADEVQHLGDLPHADRRGRLVHQHDLRRRTSIVRAIATAWRWPPDICLTRSRGRVSDFSSRKISPARAYMAP